MTTMNNPGLRWYVGAMLAGLVLVALWLLISNAGRNGDPLPHLGSVPAFTLTSEAGAGIDNRLFADRVSIVDFIFTSCSGICPVMSGRMAWLQDTLRNRPEVQFVSFSVDPATDTPEVLREYGKRYGAVPGRWTFLTGEKDQIYSICRTGFRLGLEAEADGAILHSTKFVLVDGRGSIRGYYDSDSTGAIEALISHARRLAEEPGS
jgi:protein SCO1/2